MEGTLMLILGKNCVEVSKEKLASKSRYFASLFSHNFADSHNEQHVINYDIALSTLQNFIEWTHDDKQRLNINYHSIKHSMIKFLKNNFEDLLSLLELSVLFVVDELISDIEDVIILFWLVPEKVIEIWLFAQELGLKVLQDICISICLDRFEDLSSSTLLKLNKDNFTQLLLNVNVRAPYEKLDYLRQSWMQRHKTTIPGISVDSRPKFIRTMVVHKLPESINTGEYLYLWNGNASSECTQVNNVHGSQKVFTGMGITGRGFSLYAAGGEMGLGSGRMNNIIWRYCLISKKWFYCEQMPQPKRHMIIVFIGNELLVVGGVGKNRIKSNTVDVLDIHKGTWRRGPTLPCSFIGVPPHCVINGILFLITTNVYMYNPQSERWDEVVINSHILIDACLTPNTTLFRTPDTTFIEDDEDRDKTTLLRIDAVKEPVCEKKDCLGQYWRTLHKVDESGYTGQLLSYAKVADIGVMLLQCIRDGEYKYLHLHTESKKDFVNFIIPRGGGSFQLIDPDTLYNTMEL